MYGVCELVINLAKDDGRDLDIMIQNFINMLLL